MPIFKFMNKSLISIIIPTFNQGTYLKRCLTSIENQTFKDFEIIIIDKYSTDNTKIVVDEFSHLPIKFLQIENNGNIANSRNYGIKNSTGNVIAFLDSDDIWTNDKLDSCYRKIIEGHDIIFHNLKIIGNSKNYFKKILKGRVLKHPILRDLLVKGNPIFNSSVMVKKNILEQVNLINENKKMIASEDYNLWLKISNVTKKFYYINQNLGSYQLNHNGISKRKNMSYSTLFASREFFSLLSHNEKNLARSRIFYIGGKFFFQKKNIIFVKKNY